MLTANRLRELIDYSPDTGEFRWRSTRNGFVKAGDIAGSRNAEGYQVIMLDGRSYKASRLAFLWMTSTWPALDVDHKDLNRANNRWLNLRIASDYQNACNRPLYKNNTSGNKGVYPHGERRYRARIRVDGKLLSLGIFESREDAVAAYAAASDKFHGEFGRVA